MNQTTNFKNFKFMFYAENHVLQVVLLALIFYGGYFGTKESAIRNWPLQFQFLKGQTFTRGPDEVNTFEPLKGNVLVSITMQKQKVIS